MTSGTAIHSTTTTANTATAATMPAPGVSRKSTMNITIPAAVGDELLFQAVVEEEAVQGDRCEGQQGDGNGEQDQHEVDADVERRQLAEPRLERQREQERGDDLRAGLEDAELLEELVPVAVGALTRGLESSVIGIDVAVVGGAGFVHETSIRGFHARVKGVDGGGGGAEAGSGRRLGLRFGSRGDVQGVLAEAGRGLLVRGVLAGRMRFGRRRHVGLAQRVQHQLLDEPGRRRVPMARDAHEGRVLPLAEAEGQRDSCRRTTGAVRGGRLGRLATLRILHIPRIARNG
jgi:hypothetical protein